MSKRYFLRPGGEKINGVVFDDKRKVAVLYINGKKLLTKDYSFFGKDKDYKFREDLDIYRKKGLEVDKKTFEKLTK